MLCTYKHQIQERHRKWHKFYHRHWQRLKSFKIKWMLCLHFLNMFFSLSLNLRLTEFWSGSSLSWKTGSGALIFSWPNESREKHDPNPGSWQLWKWFCNYPKSDRIRIRNPCLRNAPKVTRVNWLKYIQTNKIIKRGCITFLENLPSSRGLGSIYS